MFLVYLLVKSSLLPLMLPVGGTHAPAELPSAVLPYGAPVYPLLQPVIRGVQFVAYSLHFTSLHKSPIRATDTGGAL